jgi:CheY-like chemotaxis protein/DNA-binding XRE family transcriptional regulator
MLSLREAREARGLSLEALAERAGVGASTLLRIEHGRTRPRPTVVRRVSEALGLSPLQIAEFAGRRPGAEGPPPRVLVVDDEPGVRAVVAELLAGEGYATAEAGDGLAALAAAAADPPDAVVTNLGMPRLGGQGLIRRLRADRPGLPVVAMSAREDQPLVPGVPFVAKPFRVERLLAELAGALRRGGGRGRPPPGGEAPGGSGPGPEPGDVAVLAARPPQSEHGSGLGTGSG